MDLQQLRYFVTVAEVENFSLAAHRLRVAQSAVSRQVRLLEQELGATLLRRAGRGVKLTETGETLRRRATDLIRHADDLRSDIRGRGNAPTGILRVGANPSLGDAVFPSLARSYMAAYPKVRLHLKGFPLPSSRKSATPWRAVSSLCYSSIDAASLPP